ncbi:MAG TPA: DUF5908 family protein [Saprospiraceae bacterium]|nr:DUF5908 family protein [Saprospiraceae bacterium]HND87909.1 DUF5908 family protein [Saprospiraceae bacterium]HNG89281.1 DUF5908 family protein [Saprospiraceae bacterium]
MPIEITELIVRARIDADRQDERNASAASSPAASASNGQGISPQVQAIEKAVQEAITLIKRKNER